jgi:hypothetical protein
VTTDFPVLSAGPTPQIKVESWNLALQLGGSLLWKWSWAEFEALPQATVKTNIHCRHQLAEARYYLADSLDQIRGLSDFKPPAAAAEHWPDFEATMGMLRRNAISWPAELDLVCRSYAPHLERLHEDAALRQADLPQLFASFREISGSSRLPDGPERARTTCQPRSHIELVSEKARTAKLVGLESVSGSTT